MMNRYESSNTLGFSVDSDGEDPTTDVVVPSPPVAGDQLLLDKGDTDDDCPPPPVTTPAMRLLGGGSGSLRLGAFGHRPDQPGRPTLSRQGDADASAGSAAGSQPAGGARLKLSLTGRPRSTSARTLDSDDDAVAAQPGSRLRLRLRPPRDPDADTSDADNRPKKTHTPEPLAAHAPTSPTTQDDLPPSGAAMCHDLGRSSSNLSARTFGGAGCGYAYGHGSPTTSPQTTSLADGPALPNLSFGRVPTPPVRPEAAAPVMSPCGGPKQPVVIDEAPPAMPERASGPASRAPFSAHNQPQPPAASNRPPTPQGRAAVNASPAPAPRQPAFPPLSAIDIPTIPNAMDKYEVKAKLGEGTYGEVYLAVDREAQAPVAVKKLKVLQQMEGLPTTTLREIAILKTVANLADTRHFARLREVAMSPHFTELQLVFDFVEHSLYGLMVNGVRFSDADIRCVFRQVLKGLAVLHDATIVHRDIKPNNILIDSTGTVKICDFGLAFSTSAGRDRVTPRLVALAYRPPEMLLGARQYGSPVDLWATGCMLAQVFLGGAPPFMRSSKEPAGTDIEQLEIIAAAHRLQPEHVAALLELPPPGTDPKAVQQANVAVLSEAQLAANLRAHLGNMARIRQRPPIPAPVVDVICKCLALRPASRPTARDALELQWFANTVNEAVERAAMARNMRESVGSKYCHTAARR